MSARDIARRSTVSALVEACELSEIYEGDALSLLAKHDAEHRAEVLREGADEVWGMPAPDCSDMSSMDDAWESGAEAAAARLRELADEAMKEKDTREGESTPADLTIYRASHDSIVMGHYTTRQAAYEHCEAHELRDDAVSPMSWDVDEDGVAELVRIRVPRSPGAESPTGFVVTPLTVASAYDEEADE